MFYFFIAKLILESMDNSSKVFYNTIWLDTGRDRQKAIECLNLTSLHTAGHEPARL